MPPSEHMLVHELSHGNAKIIMSSDHGKTGFWLVTRDGKLPSRKLGLTIYEMLLTLCYDEEEELHPLAAENAVERK